MFGWLAALGGLASGIGVHIFGRWSLDLSSVGPVLDRVESLLAKVTPGAVAVSLTVLFAVGLLFWLTSVVAEGALIWAGSELAAGKGISFQEVWSAGVRYLGRLAAVDAIVFIPIFLLLLAVQLIASGGVIATIFVLTRPEVSSEGLLTTIGLTGATLTPFLCLIIPVGVATYFLRILAYRSAVAAGLDTRQSVREAWQLLRVKAVHVIVLGLLLWSLRYLLRLPLSILSVIVTSAGAMSLFFPSLSQQLFGFGSDYPVTLLGLALSVISALFNGIVGVFVSMSWTLAFLEWTEMPSSEVVA